MADRGWHRMRVPSDAGVFGVRLAGRVDLSRNRGECGRTPPSRRLRHCQGGTGGLADPRTRRPKMTALDPIPYTDAKLRRILSSVRTIAMVGASSNWNRPSYFVMKYLQGKGYRVIPVNPANAGQEQLGERVYASLRDIPDKVDMVEVFRASDQVGPVVDDAIAI